VTNGPGSNWLGSDAQASASPRRRVGRVGWDSVCPFPTDGATNRKENDNEN
jgi:hypothetical protein